MERPEFWGLYPSLRVLFYISAAISLSFFLAGSYKRLKTWQTGVLGDGAEPYFSSLPGFAWYSFKTLFTSGCLFARRSFRVSRPRALFLVAVQWSFLALFLGTILSFINFHVVKGFLTGQVYFIYKLVLDWAGVVFTVCLLVAIARRVLMKKLPSSGYDYFLLLLMLSVVLSAFAAQGARFSLMPWPGEPWSPFGRLFKLLFAGLDDIAVRETVYNAAWGVHALLALILIGYLPYSSMFHIFAAQITTEAAKLREKEAGIV